MFQLSLLSFVKIHDKHHLLDITKDRSWESKRQVKTFSICAPQESKTRCNFLGKMFSTALSEHSLKTASLKKTLGINHIVRDLKIYKPGSGTFKMYKKIQSLVMQMLRTSSTAFTKNNCVPSRWGKSFLKT
jgi:hypothetical protein